MKTIVINTSKEATNTKLDILFKAPFDSSSLIWQESGLGELKESAGLIKQTLISDTDVIDRDYNLIVLVDLYNFPRGNELEAAELYKKLLVKYIRHTLVKKLHEEYNLIPKAVGVFFANSADEAIELDYDSLLDNPVEQARIEREKAAHEEKEFKNIISNQKNGELEDESFYVKSAASKRDKNQILMMEMFSWTEDITKENLKWDLKCSIGDEEVYLDFSEVFGTVVQEVNKSDRTVKCMEIVFEGLKSVMFDNNEAYSNLVDGVGRTAGECKISELTYSFKRDNEQNVVEGFFAVFANIFYCVQNKKIIENVKEFSKDEIQTLLVNAFKKYKFFSLDENIDIKFEPIDKIYENRDTICKKWIANRPSNEFYKKSADEVADMIMGNNSKKSTSGGLDKAFFGMVTEIFENYDEKRISQQNDMIVEKCITYLWAWRDKQNSNDYKKAVDAALTAANVEDVNAKERCELTFIKDKYEKEYGELVDEVTKIDHSLVGNKNILLETKELIVKYNDLVRKGRVYLVSTIGAFIAVLMTVAPYLYLQHYSNAEDVLHKALYIVFMCLFVGLYCTAIMIYIGFINKQKRKLKDELAELKKQSEQARRDSIKALFNYYTQVIEKTESFRLLWREIVRRDRENAKMGIKRNNHKKRLSRLAGAIERFMTMLKFNVDDEDLEVTSDDEKRYRDDGLCLECKESFYSSGNQRIYSVLNDEKTYSDNGDRDKKGEENR